jgi:hypothetical protein
LLFTPALAVKPAGAVIVTPDVALHPLLSFTVTLYVPADNALMDVAVPPLLQVYVYGVRPPPPVTDALPVLAQAVAFPVTLALAVTVAGAVMTALAVAVHPFLSVTVTV